MDLMGTAGQTRQHGACIRKIDRLPEQLAIEIDHGITAEHKGSWPHTCHGSRLFARETPDLFNWRQPNRGVFAELRRAHLEGKAQQCQEFLAAWRTRRQH
jgi:hypothetical protein